MCEYIKLMRVHHYLKNCLLFLPIVFSKQIFNIETMTKTALGFVGFCLISSTVYIINDIKDVEKDRCHPTKCQRPIASGKVDKNSAIVLAIILFMLSILLNIMASNKIIALILLLIYLLLNILYSFGLKDIPLIDIAILVSGFLIRVLYGATLIDIQVSNWLYLTIMSMSFYLGLGKRRNEITRQGDMSRKVLRYYNHKFLDKNMYICLGLTIVFYALWCVDPNTIISYSNKNIIWTVPLVMLICMKYSLTIEGNSSGDPVDVLLKDKILVILVSIYSVIMFYMIYV